MARKQLNIRLEEEIHTQAKINAILKSQTLNEYIENAINQALEQDKDISGKINKTRRKTAKK